MNEKPVYAVLNNLINTEWKTSFQTRLNKNKVLTFRGFRGKYLLAWKDRHGKTQRKEIMVE